ncbi:MAG: hypothetical protein HC897_13020 [Thermoanaerobaculia bacterium]|nr:hypothetical protein [Thermoanaerobaculia bacterium]
MKIKADVVGPRRRLTMNAGGWISESSPTPRTLAFSGLGALLLAGCYSLQWTRSAEPQPPPETIAQIFAASGGKLGLELLDPNDTYRHDPPEKDAFYAHDPELLRFRRGEIRLHTVMPPGRVLVDLSFSDAAGNTFTLPEVDLLRIIPKIDTEGELQYPELLNEEYNRYSINFRREHQEVRFEIADPRARPAADRAYRAVLSNNCLDPTKWEIALTSEDYSNFAERLAGGLYLNQDRMLAHSWFFLDRKLYLSLLRLKNPDLAVDLTLLDDYDALSRRAEQVVVDLERLRAMPHPHPSQLLEIAHQSARPLVAIDAEQMDKWQTGLFLNREQFKTYRDLLSAPVTLAAYADNGFYRPDQPKLFDYSWLRDLDQVQVATVAADRAGTYVELTLDGVGSPYQIKLGNVDLAMLDEQRLFEFAFGFNVYSLSRRHSPPQSTIVFDQDLMPDDVKPYLLMLDKKTGRYVNQELKGVDRLYLGWESIDRDVLEIYLISYERILPVWLARVELADDLVDRTRVRRSLYG